MDFKVNNFRQCGFLYKMKTGNGTFCEKEEQIGCNVLNNCHRSVLELVYSAINDYAAKHIKIIPIQWYK